MREKRTRRTPSRANPARQPITDHPDSPEFRALIEHSIEAYADLTRRFRLSPREAHDTAEGLRGHAARLGLAVPHYLHTWGLSSTATLTGPDDAHGERGDR